MQYAIEVNNLKKSYNENQVVKGINLQVKKGSYLHFSAQTVLEKQLPFTCFRLY
jgi:ABC-type polar amino acid transport system ATPase subunit